MKRVFALILALMMVMSLATTALADETQTTKLTVNTTGYTARTFDGYMVMSATNSGNAYNYTVIPAFRIALVKALNLTTTDLTDAQIDALIVETIQKLPNDAAVADFAAKLYNAIDEANITATFTGWNGTSKDVTQGYWLLIDTTNLTGKNEANSKVILDTAGDADVTVKLKSDVTKLEKKIDDENDSISADIANNEDGETLWDTADYDIGDKVPYVIRGQMANDVSSYSYYSFKIVDTVSAGLDHLPNTDTETNIVLNVNGVLQTIKAAGENGDADWIYEINGKTMTIYPNYGYTKNDGTEVDASAANGGDLKEVPLTAYDSATYTLRYNCLLNENAVIGAAGNQNDAKAIVSNNPYGDGFGETPLDTTITFTYQFVVDKVDPEGNKLAGAQFDLYKFMAEGKGTYAGGETVAATAADAAKNGTYFNHPHANSYGKFVQVAQETLSADGATFTFKGIDDGYYVLLETKAPDGYKAIEPVEFHVIATHVLDLTGNPVNKLTKLEAVVKGGINQTIDGDEATGTLSVEIENHAGSELPSTGGMGTTLFYVVGGLLAASALVLLVTKKRMSVN